MITIILIFVKRFGKNVDFLARTSLQKVIAGIDIITKMCYNCIKGA